jgi:hypothetical protein
MRHRKNTIPIPPHPVPEETNLAVWAMGGLLAFLFLGAVIMFARSDKVTTASNAPNGATATVPTKPSPATTTGSGGRAH